MSGWSGWPVTTSTPITYDQVIQLWQAWWRRKRGPLNQKLWPPPDVPFPGGTDSGTVAGVSQAGNSLDVVCNIGGSWGTSINGGCSGQRWVNYHCTECFIQNIPSSYDLIIIVDFYEPRTHIRMPITGQVDPTEEGGTGTLTVDASPALNAVTAGYIGSISDLDGKDYYIQARGYAWITDRYPERPDDQQQWRGSGAGELGYWPLDDTTDPDTNVVTHNDPQYMLLKDNDETTFWAVDRWVGYELMVYSGGSLKRLPIIHNDARTLYVAAANGADVGGQYSIVDVGKSCDPTRKLWHYGQWADGLGEAQASHTPDDVLSSANTLLRSTKYRSGDPCGPNGAGACEPPLTANFFDTWGNQIDYQVDPIDICAGGKAGKYLNTNIWKSFRMLMSDVEANCVNFIPVRDVYDGDHQANPYSPATWFKDIGCPSGQTTTTKTVTSTYTDPNNDQVTEYGTIDFNVSGDFVGRSIRWEIYDKVGVSISMGRSSSGPDGKIAGILSAQYGISPDNVGLKVVYTLPWTRVRPRWVKYLYPKTSFIPTVGSLTEGGDPQVIDPPVTVENDDGTIDCSLTGTWISRPASTAGVTVSLGQTYEGDPLIVGELYRYIGDNYRDPFPGGPTTGIQALTNPYEDRFYRGRLSVQNQTTRDGSRSGKVASGNYYSLTQADHNWGSDWANGGTLRTESGTATGGSGTTLVDSTKDTTNNHLPHACWWTNDGPRYPEGNAYVGFILEVDKTRTLPNPDPAVIAINPQATVQQTVTFKVPINDTSHGAGGVTVYFTGFQIPKYNASNQAWTWEGFTVAQNDPYRINEPKYERDKWAGRKLKVTAADGTVVLNDVEIRHSDSSTLYFDTQSQPIPAGATFQIIEMGMGVYRYLGNGQWTPATGADSARVSVQTPTDFLADINANNNGWVKDYGLPEYGDMMHPVWLNQLQKGIDLLRWSKTNYGWVTRNDRQSRGINYKYAGGFFFFWRDPSEQGNYGPGDVYTYEDGVSRAWDGYTDSEGYHHTGCAEMYNAIPEDFAYVDDSEAAADIGWVEENGCISKVYDGRE